MEVSLHAAVRTKMTRTLIHSVHVRKSITGYLCGVISRPIRDCVGRRLDTGHWTLDTAGVRHIGVDTVYLASLSDDLNVR